MSEPKKQVLNSKWYIYPKNPSQQEETVGVVVEARSSSFVHGPPVAAVAATCGGSRLQQFHNFWKLRIVYCQTCTYVCFDGEMDFGLMCCVWREFNHSVGVTILVHYDAPTTS